MGTLYARTGWGSVRAEAQLSSIATRAAALAQIRAVWQRNFPN